MVLPFGLDSDGEYSNRAVMTPTAPPIETDIISTCDILPRNSPYVDFIILNGADRQMVRSEKKVVIESSVELAKIINSQSASTRNENSNQFIINDIDKNDFELLLRYLETKFIKFKDHNHALRILGLADRFNCPDLVIHCVKELDLQLSSLIVLDVFRSLWYYNSISSFKSNTSNFNNTSTSTSNNASVVTHQEDKKQKGKKTKSSKKSSIKQQPFTAEDYLVALLNNTLQLIDMQAELILTKEEILQLRFKELEMIATRETLQMQSEIVLFVCLANWSSEECKRKKLELTDENRRRVLGSLCYAPRYLLMSERDFRKACDRVELLDPAELALVNDIIAGKKLTNLTLEQNNMIELFQTPRPTYAKLPIHLSDRTNPKNYCRKMRKASEKGNQTEDTCCHSFGLNCLAVFACIFD